MVLNVRVKINDKAAEGGGGGEEATEGFLGRDGEGGGEMGEVHGGPGVRLARLPVEWAQGRQVLIEAVEDGLAMRLALP